MNSITHQSALEVRVLLPGLVGVGNLAVALAFQDLRATVRIGYCHPYQLSGQVVLIDDNLPIQRVAEECRGSGHDQPGPVLSKNLGPCLRWVD